MITNIRLQNFRSYEDETIEPSPGVNIIVGPNASGKTNLLEAVLVVALGKSYRARDTELVHYEAPWARLEAHTESEDRIVKLERSETGAVVKSFVIEDQTFKRLSLARMLPVVLFEPEHLQLLRGSPEGRREFLDGLLEQTVSGYGTLLRQYKRTLTQRNSLLKKGTSLHQQHLFPWNVRLSELGGQIATNRQTLMQKLNDSLSDIYSELAGKKTSALLFYESSCGLDNYASSLLHKLEASSELDVLRGFTAYGPHRDDVRIELDGHRLQESGSRGETRTLLLSLKINELKLIEEARDKKPILLLDDVFSELDGARRRALTTFIGDYQAFITTTDADVVVQHFMQDCTIIPTTLNQDPVAS
jgi:DNA replication and repair protein RecF